MTFMCEVCVRKFTTSFCSRYRDNISHFLHVFFVQEIFSIFASSIENIVLISYIICLKPTATPKKKIKLAWGNNPYFLSKYNVFATYNLVFNASLTYSS